MLMPGVFLNSSLLAFEDSVSEWTWSLLISDILVGQGALEIYLPCSPSTGVTGVCLLGIQAQVFMYLQQVYFLSYL